MQARAESDRLNLIIDSVADPIVVTDAAGATSLMNEPAERLFTIRTRASAAEQRCVQANDAHFSSFIAGMLVSADQRRVGEIGLIDPKTGEAMPVEAIAGKILSEHGELTAVVTILHDRREAIEKANLYEQLKQASDELERKIQAATADIAQQNELLRRQAIELEQASALKSQFLANMSHEFRTPLNAMLGYTSMLLQGVAGPVEPPVKRQLNRIESNGRHLLTIINEILDISRIEAGRMPLQLSTFNIGDLVAEVRAELEPIILRSKLTITTDARKGSAADSIGSPEAQADPAQPLEQRAQVHASGRRDDQCPARAGRAGGRDLSVTDTGIGIAPADQDKIFEDFRQLDNSPTRAYGGTGPRSVDLPPARPDAGRPSHGAQPAAQGIELHADIADSRTEMKSKTPRPRVLLVDDYPDARDMYGEYLEYSGYDVIQAANGMEALQRAVDDQPDIILMDLSLPVMDGWEATRRLKANARTAAIPVVALTGHALAGISEGAKKAGCDAFVTKPCLPEDLVKEIKRILDGPSSSPTSKTRRSGKHAKTVG